MSFPRNPSQGAPMSMDDLAKILRKQSHPLPEGTKTHDGNSEPWVPDVEPHRSYYLNLTPEQQLAFDSLSQTRRRDLVERGVPPQIQD